MCVEKLRRYQGCIACPPHGYYELGYCVQAFQNYAIACAKRFKEPVATLPAPLGVEWCPYEGCSADPRYQMTATDEAKSRKASSKQYAHC